MAICVTYTGSRSNWRDIHNDVSASRARRIERVSIVRTWPRGIGAKKSLVVDVGATFATRLAHGGPPHTYTHTVTHGTARKCSEEIASSSSNARYIFRIYPLASFSSGRDARKPVSAHARVLPLVLPRRNGYPGVINNIAGCFVKELVSEYRLTRLSRVREIFLLVGLSGFVSQLGLRFRKERAIPF